ncbi:MAG: iron-sulfur cluster assembly scaffold protein [Terriglobia bacterium]
MGGTLYSPKVLDHFEHPRNVGELPDATAEVQMENPVCGDVMRLAARVENGTVTEVRFKTVGCVTAIACGSLLTERMKGRRVEELGEITDKKLSRELGGLPPATRHGAQLAADALRALLAQLRGG